MLQVHLSKWPFSPELISVIQRSVVNIFRPYLEVTNLIPKAATDSVINLPKKFQSLKRLKGGGEWSLAVPPGSATG